MWVVLPAVVPAFGGDDALLERIQQTIAAARSASLPVIYGIVVEGFSYTDLQSPMHDVLGLR